jgi:hypothetical protein
VQWISSVDCILGGCFGPEPYHGLENFVLPSCDPMSHGKSIISCANPPIKDYYTQRGEKFG